MIYLLLLLSTVIASTASFFLKKASGGSGILNMLTSKWLWLGGTFYGTSAVLNILLLQKLPYSQVVPLGALSYIWTMLISRVFLKEKLTLNKIIGVGCLIFGTVLIAV